MRASGELQDATLKSLCSLWPCKGDELSCGAEIFSSSLTGCDYYSILTHYQANLSITAEPSDGDAITDSEKIHRALSVLCIIVTEANEPSSLSRCFIPLVYSPLYSLSIHLPLVNFMLQSPDTCEYAISITENLLERLGKCKLHSEYYEVIREFPIHRSLVKVMQYASDVKVRSRAVECFRRILHAFQPEGRLLMITITLRTPGQVSGLQEFVLNEYRSSILEEKKSLNRQHRVFSTEESIRSVLTTVIPLCTSADSGAVEKNDSSSTVTSPDCSSSSRLAHDLLPKREIILGTLNFIRFFCLQDPREVNETGIWNSLDFIHSQLIAPLTLAIGKARENLLRDLNNLSREPAQYKKERLDYMNRMSLQITNDPNGKEGSQVPDDYDEQGINSSISQLDMISSVANRLVEILQLT